MKKKINIEGMMCANCVKHVTEALSELNGVTDLKVDLAGKCATIDTDGSVTDISIKNAIEEVGYDVIEIISL